MKFYLKGKVGKKSYHYYFQYYFQDPSWCEKRKKVSGEERGKTVDIKCKKWNQ